MPLRREAYVERYSRGMEGVGRGDVGMKEGELVEHNWL